MPCTYIESAEEIAAAKVARENAAQLRENKLKLELDLATRNLCFVLTTVLKGEFSSDSIRIVLAKNDELIAWWDRHQKMDKQRLAQEKAKRESERKLKSVADVKRQIAKKRKELEAEEKRLLSQIK